LSALEEGIADEKEVPPVSGSATANEPGLTQPLKGSLDGAD
jgi:hypothetical protein